MEGLDSRVRRRRLDRIANTRRDSHEYGEISTLSKLLSSPIPIIQIGVSRLIVTEIPIVNDPPTPGSTSPSPTPSPTSTPPQITKDVAVGTVMIGIVFIIFFIIAFAVIRRYNPWKHAMRQRQLEGTFQHAELWEQYQELHRIQARNRGAESDEEANIEGSTGCELVTGFSKMTVKQQRDIVHSLLITKVVVASPSPSPSTVESLSDESSSEHRGGVDAKDINNQNYIAVGTLEPCAICLADYREGDQICSSKNVNCSHSFHEKCIFEWVLLRPHACPCCRQNYLLPDEPSNSDEICESQQGNAHESSLSMTIAPNIGES